MSKNFIKNIFTEDELWKKSKKGDISILKDRNVFLIKNDYGNTPLHILALCGKVEVLNYPEVVTLKNNYEATPLHLLAWAGRIELLNHPEVIIVKDIYGNTPLHYLVAHTNVLKESIQKLFPWYPLKDEEIDKNLITKILNTPNSVRFIYE